MLRSKQQHSVSLAYREDSIGVGIGKKRARGSRVVPSLYGLWRAGIAVQALAQSLPPDQVHEQHQQRQQQQQQQQKQAHQQDQCEQRPRARSQEYSSPSTQEYPSSGRSCGDGNICNTNDQAGLDSGQASRRGRGARHGERSRGVYGSREGSTAASEVDGDLWNLSARKIYNGCSSSPEQEGEGEGVCVVSAVESMMCLRGRGGTCQGGEGGNQGRGDSVYAQRRRRAETCAVHDGGDDRHGNGGIINGHCDTNNNNNNNNDDDKDDVDALSACDDRCELDGRRQGFETSGDCDSREGPVGGASGGWVHGDDVYGGSGVGDGCVEVLGKADRIRDEAGDGALSGGVLEYDFSRSTEEMYRADHRIFTNRFREARSLLDYTYHFNYSISRQQVQDRIIEGALLNASGSCTSRKWPRLQERSDEAQVQHRHQHEDEEERRAMETERGGRCSSSPSQSGRPWAVFTAGAMGAGKSHVMSLLDEEGIFPMDAFVQVDPDRLRRELPEMSAYLERDEGTAGSLTHKEAGFMAEILEETALLEGRNILVDGSLRDDVWYSEHIKDLRRRFPRLRVAIIHVWAPEEQVIKRAAHRAAETGRTIPPSVLLNTIRTVPASVEKLAPLADYCVTIDNGTEKWGSDSGDTASTAWSGTDTDTESATSASPGTSDEYSRSSEGLPRGIYGDSSRERSMAYREEGGQEDEQEQERAETEVPFAKGACAGSRTPLLDDITNHEISVDSNDHDCGEFSESLSTISEDEAWSGDPAADGAAVWRGASGATAIPRPRPDRRDQGQTHRGEGFVQREGEAIVMEECEGVVARTGGDTIRSNQHDGRGTRTEGGRRRSHCDHVDGVCILFADMGAVDRTKTSWPTVTKPGCTRGVGELPSGFPVLATPGETWETFRATFSNAAFVG